MNIHRNERIQELNMFVGVVVLLVSAGVLILHLPTRESFRARAMHEC